MVSTSPAATVTDEVLDPDAVPFAEAEDVTVTVRAVATPFLYKVIVMGSAVPAVLVKRFTYNASKVQATGQVTPTAW